MKKLVLLFLVGLAVFTPQLHSISLEDYIRQNGTPQIHDVVLDLSHNNLTDLTGLQNIPNINQVEILYLMDNQLQTLPPTIFNGLNNLRMLSLNNNQLETLPATLFNGLYNLDTLALHDNQLQTLLPNIFNGLNNLRKLSLNNNQLQELPNTLFHGLDKLQFLDLRGNSFKSDFIPTLTDMIRSIPNLKQLNGKPKTQALHEHPFVTLKQLIAERIAQNIDQYRHRLHELPSDVLDLLPLTPQQRAGIAAEKR